MEISLAVLSAGLLFRMYFNAFRYVPISRFGEPSGLRLRRPTISSYLLRAAAEQHIYRPFILFRDALFHLRCSRAFRNPVPSQSSGRANLEEDRSRIALFIGIRTFPTIFSKYTERAAVMLHAGRFINLASC